MIEKCDLVLEKTETKVQECTGSEGWQVRQCNSSLDLQRTPRSQATLGSPIRLDVLGSAIQGGNVRSRPDPKPCHPELTGVVLMPRKVALLCRACGYVGPIQVWSEEEAAQGRFSLSRPSCPRCRSLDVRLENG